MAEIIINILLGAVIATAMLFWRYVQRKDSRGLNKKQKSVLKRIGVSAAMALMLQFISAEVFYSIESVTFYPLGRLLRLTAYLIVYWVIGHDILKKAWKGIRNGRVFDENFLMAIATVGAFFLAAWKSGDYLEAVAVMLFYQLGELFQGYAVGKSRRNIIGLMDIRPDYANIEKDGKLERVDPNAVEIGTVIVVKPGEKVPIDGVVAEGFASLNTSALTGESLPRDVVEGDAVNSGCINMTGILKIRTTKVFQESTVSKILGLLENASSRKAKSETFIGKLARIYTPVVCYGAIALAVLPPVFQMLFLNGVPMFGVWVYRALTFLIISCPCALVISIPLSFFAGIGGASRVGILIKGSNYMETLSRVKTVVFDKTGTLTKGTFGVIGIYHNQMPKEDLLMYAAFVESASSHPIAKSIQTAYGKEIDRKRISDLVEISGQGITAKVDGKRVAAGNGKLMTRCKIPYTQHQSAGTVVYVAVEGQYAGCVVVADVIKPTALTAIRELNKNQVQKTVMLTGDTHAVAQEVGKSLGLDEIYSELLPEDKVREVETLLKNQKRKEKLAFVGDGMNDAPVLSLADVGIAMGGMGSDAAIEAADVVLMDDDPVKVPKAIQISRKCLGIVYQNIVFALGVKFACLALGALGIANMWFAIFADVGVMVLAVLNAIRALWVK